MSANDWKLEVTVPANATEAQTERLIQAAIDKKVDEDIDRMLGDAFK